MVPNHKLRDMTKKEIIAKIQELEKTEWESYNNYKTLAESDRFGNVAIELEKTARTRWVALYELMDKLEIGPAV
jgi:hypothetical protein